MEEGHGKYDRDWRGDDPGGSRAGDRRLEAPSPYAGQASPQGQQAAPQPSATPADQVPPDPRYQQVLPAQPVAQYQQPADKRTNWGGLAGRVLGILAAVGAAFLAAQVVLGAIAVGTLSLGLATCARSCSDDPIGDSRADAAFISDATANDRDLETIDALRPALDHLWERRDLIHSSSPDSAEAPVTIDELRAQVEAGAWPHEPRGYGGEGGALDPQTWVRLAELAQGWMEGETGERWQVYDFAYPFPDSGPIPVPATRGESSSVTTRLLCVSGEDEGLCVDVQYYRWRTPATFESDLEQVRGQLGERTAALREVSESSLLAGRRFLVDGAELYVWSTGEDDGLRDPEAFAAFANEAVSGLPLSAVSLMVPDTPVVVSFWALSYDYPNDRPSEGMSLEDAQRSMTYAGNVCSFDYAQADLLLRGTSWGGEKIAVGDLRGVLAPDDTAYDYGLNRWVAPREGSTFDEGMAQTVAEIAGCDPGEVIATSWRDVTDTDDETVMWVVVPRGSAPESPEAFCSFAASVRDAAWGRLDIDHDRRMTLYVRIYVVDPDAVTDAAGEPVPYGDLCRQARDDLSSLGECDLRVVLGIMPSSYLWEGDTVRDDMGCEPGDIDGELTRSREWHHGAVGGEG